MANGEIYLFLERIIQATSIGERDGSKRNACYGD
jgi:hypothetical protein